MQKDVKEAFQVLISIYAIAILVYILFIHSTLFTLIPLSILMTIYLVRKKDLIPLTLYATTFFISTVAEEGPYLSVPLSIVVPFIIANQDYRSGAEIRTQAPLGPATLYISRYLLASLLLTLITPQVLIPIGVASSTILIYIIYSYVRLSKVSIVISAPNNVVVLGEEASAILYVDTPLRIHIVLEYRDTKEVYTVDYRKTIRLTLPMNRIGRHTVEINVYVFDYSYLSCRYMGRYTLEYNVTPLTQKVLEVTAEYLSEATHLVSLPPAVELTIVELSEEPIITRAYGANILDILYKHLRRVRQRTQHYILFKRFLEILYAAFSEANEEGYKRSRYGEYFGVRHYIPGDPIRHIHWKKSVSKGMLMIKEFTSSTPEDLPFAYEEGGIEPIIIVDLYAPNPYELDRLIFIFLKLILEIFKRNPMSSVLLIIVVGNALIGLKGKSIDILKQLYKVFIKISIKTLFNYTQLYDFKENHIAEIILNKEKPRPLIILLMNNEMFADRLVRLILENGFKPPKPFTIVYSNSLSFRYTIVKRVLDKYGFIHIDIGDLQKLIKTARG